MTRADALEVGDVVLVDLEPGTGTAFTAMVERVDVFPRQGRVNLHLVNCPSPSYHRGYNVAADLDFEVES